MFDEKIAARFWRLIDTSEGDDACWFPKSRADCDRSMPWFQYPSSFAAYGKSYIMHKVAYILWYGSIPAGKILRHRCGYGACCNPRHLLPGTQRENQWDRYARMQAGLLPGELATYEDITEYCPVAGWPIACATR